MRTKRCSVPLAFFLAVAALAPLSAAPMKSEPAGDQADNLSSAAPDQSELFHSHSASSDGKVTVGGNAIDYRAVAGTLIVHPKDWNDSAWREKAAKADDKDKKDDKDEGKEAEASMFYVAYFKKGAPSADRPITFLFNGGPGSSTVWLHMGAFGPRRVLTPGDTHMAAAPYRLVDNAYSLLDVSDLVFIDAPGTGFSRIAGKDKEKAFYGVDPDANAFSQFILGFLSKYGRWNSPKFLFGESYGTPRNANLVNILETGNFTDLNGVIQLSQILNFDLSADTPQFNPGTDQPYIVALPTYAASAWYHDRTAAPKPSLEAWLQEAEQFATGEYASALQQGAAIDPARKRAVAEQVSKYIGLPVDYILKSDLRVNGGQFEKNLQDASGMTTGRLDTRFSGPDLDPLSREAEYDPQSASIGSAYVSAFNDYARNELHYGDGQTYKGEVDFSKFWTSDHQPPGATSPQVGILNLMPDLASAMKYNPKLKVLLAGGYYDLATPYFEGVYEMRHLPIPARLQDNIEYHHYPSGHMVYANEQSLKMLHDDVANFIRKNAK
ncbi:MAG: peptidase serine carboxypeptidase [Alphaproteobacteria bacterium]|nr:peptidase serine carboxypeptidase [Alphaproteobacteria bacterium]